MNFFPVIPLFAAAINLALAFFIFTRDVRSRMNQVFLLWGAALATWNLGASVLYRLSDPADALFWARFTHMGVIFCPVAVLHLSALLTRRNLGPWLFAAYGATVGLAVSNCTDQFIPSVRYTGYAWFAVPGAAFWVFVPAFTAMTWPALYMIWRGQRETRDSQHHRRLATLLAADGLLMTLGSHDLLPVLGFDTYPLTNVRVYPWGQLGACGYGLLVAYSVLHYQLLDIRVSLGRQAATLVRLVFLICIAGILFALGAVLVPGAMTFRGYLVGMSVILASALVAGQFFPRLIGGQTERLERRILGDHFEYQEQAGAFIARINEYTDLKKLLDDTVNHLREVQNLASAYLVVLDPRTQEMRQVVGYPTVKAGGIALTADAPLLDFFRLTDARHLDFRQNSGFFSSRAEKDAKTCLAAVDPEFVFPLRRQNLLLGLLAIGRKSQDAPITQLDYELCANLAHELSLALDRIHVAEQVALNEKLELLSIMSRGLAHDLNNLLTPIWTFIQVHEGVYTSGPEADLLKVATRNTQAIRSYVHEAIFFSTNLKLNLGPIRTEELLNEVAEINSSRAARRGCKIVIVDEASCSFTADKVLIQRMLTNLVSNALDASRPEGEVRLQAILLPGAKAGISWLRFLVIDHGAGISRENLARVFEPYFTTKDTGDDTRGFGLGLTIVQRIVFLHGGSVDLRSTAGSGTTVQVDLPRQPLTATT